MTYDLITAIRSLMASSMALAETLDTLPATETQGDAKRCTPGNMFLSVGSDDVRRDIRVCRTLLEAAGQPKGY